MRGRPFEKGWKGGPGRPRGSRNAETIKADLALDETFDKMQDDPASSLEAYAKKYPREFYALYFGKRASNAAETLVVRAEESVSEEHARHVAEGYLDSLRSGQSDSAKEPDRLHDDVSPGLPGSTATP
jgi:hypothetical protein